MVKIKVTFQSIAIYGPDWELCWNYPKRIITYIYINAPENDIRIQLYPDEIVIPQKKICVKHHFPIKKPVTIEYEASKHEGFTRAEIAKKVCEDYKRLSNMNKVTCEVGGVCKALHNVPYVLTRRLRKF